ncbi:hypothetical protein LJC48_05855 [Desulfovibrio sp. OttesenSCG-928-C06]|nr:hypothetical protein [Desulfovibrio sp. OttesenSCG-928-C06]
MSDDFRIYGRSTGGGGYQKPGSGLERFKKGRKQGDVVRGVFISLEPASPGTAWVNLEGEKLLAQLPPEWAALARSIAAASGVGAQPGGPSENDFPLRHGDTCFFILEALEPEPHLRMLHLDGSGSAGGATGAGGAGGTGPRESLEAVLAREQAGLLWRNVCAMPPAQLASRYASLRGRMDALLKDLWGREPEEGTAQAAGLGSASVAGSTGSMAARREAYLRFLAADSGAAAIYAELNLYRAAFLLAMKPHGLLSFNYLPRLFPQASAVEMARLYKPREIFVLQATLGGSTRFEISGKCGFQTGLPAGGPQLHEVLLAPGHPDLLGSLLGLYPESVRGGFSRRT